MADFDQNVHGLRRRGRKDSIGSAPVGNHQNPQTLDPALLAKLQCPSCQTSSLSADGRCSKCGQAYPIRDGRFPDFLNDSERLALAAELKFWEDHFAGVDYADESEQSYQSWAKLLAVKPDDDALEIGCGSGALLKRLPARTRVGLEPAESLLRPSSGFHGVIGPAERLPFRDGSFDLVFFKHSLHHVGQKKKALGEAARVLKPGGRLIVMEPNAEHPQRRLISDPQSWLRKSGLLIRKIGPVESFQSAAEVQADGRSFGLRPGRLMYMESEYDRLTIRQALQRVYSRTWGLVLPERWTMPNYFLELHK